MRADYSCIINYFFLKERILSLTRFCATKRKPHASEMTKTNKHKSESKLLAGNLLVVPPKTEGVLTDRCRKAAFRIAGDFSASLQVRGQTETLSLGTVVFNRHNTPAARISRVLVYISATQPRCKSIRKPLRTKQEIAYKKSHQNNTRLHVLT